MGPDVSILRSSRTAQNDTVSYGRAWNCGAGRTVSLVIRTESRVLEELMQRDSQGPESHAPVLDWNLPGLHGSKLLRNWRAHPRFNPAVAAVFTSSSSELDRDLAKKLGADRFVTKAVDLDDFFHALVSLQELV